MGGGQVGEPLRTQKGQCTRKRSRRHLGGEEELVTAHGTLGLQRCQRHARLALVVVHRRQVKEAVAGANRCAKCGVHVDGLEAPSAEADRWHRSAVVQPQRWRKRDAALERGGGGTGGEHGSCARGHGARLSGEKNFAKFAVLQADYIFTKGERARVGELGRLQPERATERSAPLAIVQRDGQGVAGNEAERARQQSTRRAYAPATARLVRGGAACLAQVVHQAAELVELHQPRAVGIIRLQHPRGLAGGVVDAERAERLAQLSVVEPARAVDVEALEGGAHRVGAALVQLRQPVAAQAGVDSGGATGATGGQG
eukprot:scaffold124878_cov63-Phaeocystis_antarctica.AAC.5